MKKIKAIEYVFFVLLTLCFFPIVSLAINDQNAIQEYRATIPILILLLGLLFMLTGLICNARRAFPYALIVLLGYQLVCLVQLNLSFPGTPFSIENPSLTSFKTSRNILLLILLIYGFLHLAIHTIKYAINKKHSVFSKYGLIQLGVIVVFWLWNFLFASLLTSLIRIFYLNS